MIVSYFSAGVSSAVATKLMIKEIDRIMYTHIDDQHPDTMRFIRDCEAWFGKPVEVLQSHYRSVDAVCRAVRWISSPKGAACTSRLKINVRKEFERENMGTMRIVWGYDAQETARAKSIEEFLPHHWHSFPLIDQGIGKAEAHEILTAAGIKRPAMYDLGYHNNNCIGCIKAGMGYWNKIRIDFPEVFESRSRLERDIGHSIISGVYLDELDPEAGRMDKPITGECGLFCDYQRSRVEVTP